MLDFFKVKELTRNNITNIVPEFKSGKIKDLMIRGGKFYAIWDEENNVWSQNEADVQRIVDTALWEYVRKHGYSQGYIVRTMEDYSTGSWSQFKKYIRESPDNFTKLDRKVTFSNSVTSKKDYVSKHVDYPLEEASCEAYEKIISTLYVPEERAKIEWAIGSVVAGESIDIQKFCVFYGKPGSGKSTILHIIERLFEGYYTTFEAKALASNSNQFATEVFRNGPLVAIQHDGDLSRIEDNTKLNSIIAHEKMTINIKNHSMFTDKADCMLFMGTNKEVKITDAKSGIIRRLIDIRPSGRTIPVDEFRVLEKQTKFELSGIAWRCLQVYKEMGKDYYITYKPFEMLYKSNAFYNFVEYRYFEFLKNDSTTLKAAWEMYNEYYKEAGLQYKMPMYIFREELKNYFETFDEITRINGKQVRSYYSGFKSGEFNYKVEPEVAEDILSKGYTWLKFAIQPSKLDILCADCKAQYASEGGVPTKKWSYVRKTLKDLDTRKLHYVKVPENHIVIDLDIRGENGEKNLLKNMEAATRFPKTYAEVSKSGSGIHLHYIYNGDINELSHMYDKNIEVKTFTGNASLRRMLTKCNDIDISVLTSGLPKKEAKKKMINIEGVRSEQQLRALIEKNLKKEIHDNTTQSINFIYALLEEAYNGGTLTYDVRDMAKRVKDFANASTNQAETCFKTYQKMHFCSENIEKAEQNLNTTDSAAIDILENRTGTRDTLVIFDVECKPNLFLVCYKEYGEGNEVVAMVDPTSDDIAHLMEYKLIGYNNLNYDNAMILGRLMGDDDADSFNRNNRIIVKKDKTAKPYRSKYVSYTDVLDFSAIKQSLKAWEIQLGLPHKEYPERWDQPISKDKIPELIEYCKNDVLATEAVFNHLKPDWTARNIMAEITGMTVNDRTNDLSCKFIVGDDPNPQSSFVYTDLSEMFKGYEFDPNGIDKNRYPKDEKGKPIYVRGKSIYRGEDPGEGGYVYAEPGIYRNVALLDIASMHPTSIICLNLFGDRYTANYKEIYEARLAIKHKEFDKAKTMFGGKLARYLDDPSTAKDLAYALKIALNSVYGLTSASFPNPLKDPRNVDNIVAKRGALFMIDLKHAVQEKGYTVAHIKTDSIKIPDATPEIIQFVMDFGKKYGYSFEHEATYEKMCLVNDAVYIAKYSDCTGTNGDMAGIWTATGAQFQHPYVFKYLFSKAPIEFKDCCETKSVTTALYLDMNEGLPENEHKYVFVGRTGLFVPILPGHGGGILLRLADADEMKFNAAGGSKGFRWMEAEKVEDLKLNEFIDYGYFRKLVDKAIETISKYGDFYEFASDDSIDIESDELPF